VDPQDTQELLSTLHELKDELRRQETTVRAQRNETLVGFAENHTPIHQGALDDFTAQITKVTNALVDVEVTILEVERQAEQAREWRRGKEWPALYIPTTICTGLNDRMLLKILRFVTPLLVALLSGLAFAHVLERPAKMQYDAALYLTLQKSLYAQWGPPHIGGVLEPLAIVATGLLAFFVRKNKRDLRFSLSALFALLLAFPVVFFWLVAPANSAFLTATRTSIPLNWTDIRSNWETGHAIRFVLQFGALALLIFSLIFDADTVSSGS
jgi:hypothetical protein